jgi:hypothetical protein
MTTGNKTKIHTVYKTQDGKRVPSVTTVLGILNKPALLDWAWKCGCDGVDYKAVRDNAADIGTLAHYLIMCHLKGQAPDTSDYSKDDIDKAETCLIKYWDWEKDNPIEPLLVEAPLVSEIHRFGGTIDCLARDSHGDLVLIDHKTGKGIYSEMFYQLAAYAQLLSEQDQKWVVKSARILRIGRDANEGFEERLVYNWDRHFELFKHCLAVYRLQGELRK